MQHPSPRRQLIKKKLKIQPWDGVHAWPNLAMEADRGVAEALSLVSYPTVNPVRSFWIVVEIPKRAIVLKAL
jgi:hypothetical protein